MPNVGGKKFAKKTGKKMKKTGYNITKNIGY